MDSEFEYVWQVASRIQSWLNGATRWILLASCSGSWWSSRPSSITSPSADVEQMGGVPVLQVVRDAAVPVPPTRSVFVSLSVQTPMCPGALITA
jgi:hypothetical protein